MSLPRTIALLASVLGAISGRAELLVHLPFNGSGADLAAPGRSTVANNGAGFDRVNFKLGGAAANFNGSNFFNIPSFFPVTGNAPRSVSFWERSPATIMQNPNMTFLGWGEPGSVPNIRFDVCLENGDNTRLRCEFNVNPVISTTNSVNFCDGAWHHIVVTYNGVRLRFYVDGTVYGADLTPPQKLETGGQMAGMIIGAGMWQVNNGTEIRRRYFIGQMDDVGVWNSTLTNVDAALINGLGRVGDNDLRWLPAARRLWAKPVNSTLRINERTWMKVRGLAGGLGAWRRSGAPNGTGSYIVLDEAGDGLQIIFPWWERGWVRLLQVSAGLIGVALGLVGFISGVIWVANRLAQRRYGRQLAAKEAQESERRRIAQDLHDDLGSGLTEIMQLGDLSGQDCPTLADLQERMQAITQKTRALVAAVDEIVWTTNPRNDVVSILAGYLSDHAQEFFRVSPIRCRLDVADELPAAPVAAAARHHLFLAFKEALNNVARHSGATEIWVRIWCEAGGLKLVVEDNGRGFEPGAVGSGDGLANMKQRLQDLGGRVTIHSRPGVGTTVEFFLPFPDTAVR